MKQPLFYFPEVVMKVIKMGYSLEIPVRILRNEYMRATGVLNKKTIDKWIECLVDLGYIKFLNKDILCFSRTLEKDLKLIREGDKEWKMKPKGKK